MIKIKHFLDTVEPDDGTRIWVEPCNLAGQFRQWCKVDHVLPQLGPPSQLLHWFEQHRDGYEYFRGKYHQHLACGPYKLALQRLACASVHENITLLHQGDDPEHNTASALHEFISELEAYCPPEA